MGSHVHIASLYQLTICDEFPHPAGGYIMHQTGLFCGCSIFGLKHGFIETFSFIFSTALLIQEDFSSFMNCKG